MVFLNPERVERQGSQNPLCERSPEKGLFKEKLERKLKEKSRTDFRKPGPCSQGPAGKPESSPRGSNALIYVPLGRTPPQAAAPRRSARTLSALRKKRSEGYIAKENRPKGALIRKLIFLQPLRPKGYMAKGGKHCKTRLKLKSSSFLSEGYIDKGLFRKGISIRNFRRVYR